MNNVEIEQRIKYLIEHGGVWDDPLDDIRRNLRVLRILVALLGVGLMLNLTVVALTA